MAGTSLQHCVGDANVYLSSGDHGHRLLSDPVRRHQEITSVGFVLSHCIIGIRVVIIVSVISFIFFLSLFPVSSFVLCSWLLRLFAPCMGAGTVSDQGE